VDQRLGLQWKHQFLEARDVQAHFDFYVIRVSIEVLKIKANVINFQLRYKVFGSGKPFSDTVLVGMEFYAGMRFNE
jgi:hypothetical protein